MATVQRALDLVAEGTPVSQVAALLGVNRASINRWRSDPDRALVRPRTCCPICGDGQLDQPAYAYVLGLYLGDGTVSFQPNGVGKLRIVQTAIYTDLIAEAKLAIAEVLPNRVGTVQRPGCVEITSYSMHWACLLPQHGPGRKHERSVALVPWQDELVRHETRQFLRGLIHSDGCRSINTIRKNGKTYRYPRYFFSNASTEILGMFTDACEWLGVHWTQLDPRNVAVSRKLDVAFLDTFIGPKS